MDCLKCKSALSGIMSKPRPKAILDALEQSGIKTLQNAPESKDSEDMRPSTLNIKCVNCPEEGPIMTARAFMEAPPMSIVLCANRLQDRHEMEEALVHELVHAYDHALAKLDLTDCQQLAYSEVRAAREAECHYSPQLCSWFKKRCARKTATRSTSTLFPAEGEECVAQIFEKAYEDSTPLMKNKQPTTAVNMHAPATEGKEHHTVATMILKSTPTIPRTSHLSTQTQQPIGTNSFIRVPDRPAPATNLLDIFFDVSLRYK